MQDMFGGSSSKSSSTPKDLQSPAGIALRNPLAQALMSFIFTGGPTYQPGQNSTLASAPASLNMDWWNALLKRIAPITVTPQGTNATANTPVIPGSPTGLPAPPQIGG